MATPSKLDILRAAGKVQREIAAEAVQDDVALRSSDANVTTRRRGVQIDPVEQIVEAQEELQLVQDSLQEDQQLLHRLRGAAADGFETAAEDLADDDLGDLGDAEDDADAPTDRPQFSQAWFAKVIGAAVAAASSSSSGAPRSSKLKITDRKLPDFWEWQPVAWFRLFDRHIKPFKPSQAEAFDALLPLLSTAACRHVQPIVRTPGLDPYSRARTSLIRHFDKTPRDQAREFRRLESLGDMTPSDMLEHIMGLLPDPAVIYEVVFLDLLPPAARDAALQHTSLRAMAAAADKIVREGSSAPAVAPALTVSSVATSLDTMTLEPEVAAVSRPRPAASSSQRRPRQRSPRQPKFLCSTHARWGKNSFRCADPSSCHMKDLIRPRQEGLPPSRPSGNGRAGGQ